MAKNSKIRQSVTLFFFQTAFFKAFQALLSSKWLKTRKFVKFIIFWQLHFWKTALFTLLLRVESQLSKKTERISRQNVAAEFWKVRKSLSWKQDSARFQEFTKLLNVGTFAFCWPTGLKFIKTTEGKLKEGNNQEVKYVCMS